jgi:hypothetical protein
MAGVWCGQPGDLLGEGDPRASGVRAGETSYLHLDHHRLAAEGGVGERALVAAVHAAGGVTATRTGGRSRRAACLDDHAVAAPADLVDHDTTQMG